MNVKLPALGDIVDNGIHPHPQSGSVQNSSSDSHEIRTVVHCAGAAMYDVPNGTHSGLHPHPHPGISHLTSVPEHTMVNVAHVISEFDRGV